MRNSVVIFIGLLLASSSALGIQTNDWAQSKYQRALAGKWYRCQKDPDEDKSEGIYLNIILEKNSLIESRFLFNNQNCAGKSSKLTLTEGATLAFKVANSFQISSVEKKPGANGRKKAFSQNSDVVGKPVLITMTYRLSADLNELRLFLKSTGQNIGIYSRVIDEEGEPLRRN